MLQMGTCSSPVISTSRCLPLLLSGFPPSSVGKTSTCNAGDPSSTPGSGRSAAEGIGYPFQYSWASYLVAQLVKNPPAMWETWVCSLGWEDPLEKGKATHPGNSGLENSMDYIVYGIARSRNNLVTFTFPFIVWVAWFIV